MLGEESKKCINCGFCDAACPTYPASGYDPIITARGRAHLGKLLYDELKEKGVSKLSVTDSFYSCLDCHACVEVCPTGVDAGRVSDIGKMIITSQDGLKKKQENPVARMVVNATMKYLNPLGVREKCDSWSRGISFKSNSDTLLYTGNMYQLMGYSVAMGKRRKIVGKTVASIFSGLASAAPATLRMIVGKPDNKVSEAMDRNLRNIVQLLEKSGVFPDYMGKDEPYPGTFLNDLGYHEEFYRYSNMVSDMFRQRGYRRIITVDPHTHELLRDVYPRNVENFDFEIVYYLDLIDSSTLRGTNEEVVFHEPCHFVLSGNPYNIPLSLLSKVAKTHLAERSGKRNVCCGGPVELMFPDISDKVSSMRYDQLMEQESDKIVTACPICYANLSKHGNVVELSEILKEASAMI